MITQEEFLEKYHITNERFKQSRLQWDELQRIYDDHTRKSHTLSIHASSIATQLQLASKVHSVRWRVKNPEHLVEKIIRKTTEKAPKILTLADYETGITDLIGLRAIHLFKEDWRSIHDFINDTWDLQDKPTAYIRNGDPEEVTKQFADQGCEVTPHPFGYRSVHYIIHLHPSKKEIRAEIQVRTIFEEGWSEIDHKIRYPYELGNPVFEQFLVIFNRLAGSADEMGTFIQFLRDELARKETLHENQIRDQKKTISKLEEKLASTSIPKAQKEALTSLVEEVRKRQEDTLSHYENTMKPIFQIRQRQKIEQKVEEILRKAKDSGKSDKK